MLVVVIVLLQSSFFLSAAAGLGTEGVSFDYGWRFAMDHTEIHCDPDTFPYSLDGVECFGLRKGKGRFSPGDCREECCQDNTCLIWQFNSSQGCRIGQSDDCQLLNSDWAGGSRNPPIPPEDNPKQAAKDYNDNEWEIVDVPHDGLINGMYDQDGVQSHAYLPMKSLWYRKHFNLPIDWKDQSIWVEFRGVFRASSVYLNGQHLVSHDSGYTTFLVRLDNASSVNYGDGVENENVIAVETRADIGYTGWWYEGGGIYRHVWLFTTDHAHLVVHGVYGPSKVKGIISDHDPIDPSKGQYADVEFYPQAEVYNEYVYKSISVMVIFNLYDENGDLKGSVKSEAVTILPDQFTIFNETIPTIPNIELWSITRPYFYKLCVSLISVRDNYVFDNSTFTIGVRDTLWDPKTGFYLNRKKFTWRGFNNHNSFTGVGVALPERINLFKGQMMRAVGANSWRMSHNPPVPHLLDILDHIGVIVWDENRNFGSNITYVEAQRDMVKRDRNHPSIVAWSFCNEIGCVTEYVDEVGAAFAKVSKQMDPDRPVTANVNHYLEGNLTSFLDVQGFSHQDGKAFDSFHKDYPNKPLIGSECCSCVSQRGEDFANSNKAVLGSFNGDCNQEQTGYQLNRDFVSGCMVWTLFDYYGEPAPYGWPMVSSSYGSIDLAGFAKPSAYWYRAWWYYRAKSNATYEGYDVPINPPSLVNPYLSGSEENSDDGYMIHIVQNWEYFENKSNRMIQAYTNAHRAELIVNGKSFGKALVNWQGWAEWNGVTFEAGMITAHALNDLDEVKASHTVETAGTAAKIVTAVDVPSVRTGTGSMLVLNGQDAGMISAAVVDSQGRVVPSFSSPITFRIASGPGRIIGVGNGDPSCHELNQVPQRSAYHGLARVIVQVTEDSASSPLQRKRMIQIDRDGNIRTHIVPPDETSTAEAIVVEASAEGLGTSTVSILVTSDEHNHGVLAAAKKSMRT